MRSCVQFTVTMDAKDLRTESALSERNNDGSKYSQSGGIALHCDRNKSYQDIGSNSLVKVDVQSARPCAVIGPDRVVPPPAPSDAYLKKGPVEPWPCIDNPYHTRRPPEYPHKLANFQNPSRNISPRQTFQENMQRIMVPPSYNSVKISDDTNYVQMSDRSNAVPKNIKINMPPEAKFCDVPYTVYPNSNEQKNLRIPEMCMPSVNPNISRTAPHGWPPGSVNIRPTRTYGAPELYQYPDYSSCAGPRPVVPRPNRTVQDESGYVYAEPFYHQEGNIRFKPYPTVKERFPQQRYEYIGNYSNTFHPPPAFPSHKYELPKAVPPHPYPSYPPIKYMDRVPEPVMEGYQRNQQAGYNIPYRNQIIHPNYGPVIGNCPQNKVHSYPPDPHIKTVPPNKLPFDNSKAYIEYENGRPKMYPPSESYLVNEMGKMHPMKSQVILPNYPTINMHNISTNPYFKKDNPQMKNYEYIHFRNLDPNINIHNPMVRQPPVFSPNTSAISPTDSSASNDTSQTLGTSQEDCGYVSQSSTASVRSMDSGINRIQNDCFRKYYDNRFGPIIRTTPMMSKSELHTNSHSKEKKNLDVRQFLQMWNEGDEEADENNSKDIIVQAGTKSEGTFGKPHEAINPPNQEQLYVLGLVNVPSEELGKYEHIQKVSKLPENIKGYNHIELLNQFEEAIEFSNMSNYKSSTPKDFQMSSKSVPHKQTTGVMPPRPLSPLDVEAKISQSVIHKEVGCNFEIKPCSPKMLNVEVATPVQNILAERAIEKVSNPVMLKSPRINGIDDNIDCNMMTRKDHRMNMSNDSVRIPSCKMINAQFSNNNIDSIKNSYSLQDLESNSGLCLASLPRLDNDIELNFPEVNQQFINANKGDSSVSASLRDLPSLELLDNSDTQNKDKSKDITPTNQVNEVLKSPCTIDSEKEFSKLSKYRKSKTHSVNPKESKPHHIVNAARTDSVIIKNPENTKNYEEKSIFSPNCLNKQASDIQQVPINLTSQGNSSENTDSTENTSTIIKACDTDKSKQSSVDIAIDFSLNKSSSCNEIEECIEKNVKESEVFTHNAIETDNSLLGDHLTKLSTFSVCQSNIQDTLTDLNKIGHNSIPSLVKYDHTESVPEISNDLHYKENTNLSDNPPLRDIVMKDECLSSMRNVKESKGEDEDISTVVHRNETVDRSNSLLPIEFEAPAVELMRTSDCDSNSYLMDIDKSGKFTDANLDKANNIENNIIENAFVGDLKTNQKDVANEATTSIGKDEVYENNSAMSFSCDPKNIGSPKLDVSESKDDDNLCQFTDSAVDENSGSNHFDFSNNEKIHNEIFQLGNTNENFDSNLKSPSRDNVVVNNINDKRKMDDRNNEENLPSPKNTTSEHEFESEINKHLLGNVTKHSPKNTQFNIAHPEPNSNLNSIVPMNDVEVCQLETGEEEINFHLASLNNIISSRSPKKYSSEATEGENDLNFNSHSPSNILIPNPNDEFLTSESNFLSYSKTPNNVTVKNETTPHVDSTCLFDDESECQAGLRDTDEKVCDKVLLQNKMLETCTLKSVRNNAGLRYLSYGSKEMYSPWIQKLVIFCEGKTSNINNFNDTNNCSLPKTEPMQISDKLGISLGENVSRLNACNKSKDNFNVSKNEEFFATESPAPIEKDIDMLDSSDSNVKDKYPNLDNYCDKKYNNTAEDEKCNTITDEGLYLTCNFDEEHKNNKDEEFQAVIDEEHNNIEEEGHESIERDECKSIDDDQSKFFEAEEYKTLREEEYKAIEDDDDDDERKSIDYQEYKTIKDEEFKPIENEEFKTIEHEEYKTIEHEEYETIADEESTTVEDNKSIEDEEYKNIEDEEYKTIEDEEYKTIEDEEYKTIEDEEYKTIEDEKYKTIKDEEYKTIEDEKYKTIKDEEYKTIEDEKYKTIKDEEYKTIEDEKYKTILDEQYKTVTDENEECKNIEEDLQYKDTENDDNKNTEGVEYKNTRYEYISAADSIISSPQANDKLDCPEESSENKMNEISNQFLIGNEMDRNCDKLNIHSREEETPCCLSPITNEAWVESNCKDNNIIGKLDTNYDNNDEILKSWDNQSYTNDGVLKDYDKQYNSYDKNPESWDKQSYISDEPEEWDKLSNGNNEVIQEWDEHYKCKDDISKPWDKQSNSIDEVPEPWQKETNCDDEPSAQWEKQSNCSDYKLDQWDKQYNCNNDICEELDNQSNCSQGKLDQSDGHSVCSDLEPESSSAVVNDMKSENKVQSAQHNFLTKNRQRLKRSLSDSALNIYSSKENTQQEKEENVQFIWPFKRRKINNIHNDILAQNLCNIIQSNRRNSISAMYNEENVSFCILIDNGCIIAEEENDEQEKICYTELPEECLADIQNDSTKEDDIETVTEIISTPMHENDCEYSDSYPMQDENEKIEETWVEDVACVETVISDDIAEDIEISGPSSPKDDVLSDNEESGMFSNSDHTDKVKYIYGEKMCNDDAQFVETLYNTPQMNVNKTLVQRESLISSEYYDNDSLEKILSESNDPELSSYVPEYVEPAYSSEIVNVKETIENKENMDIDLSPLRCKGNPLNIVDMAIDKIDGGDDKLGQLLDRTQDDTVHSCESSVDNVFTYKENAESTNYTTSSSPEVSSTTSEEKNSAILLKITSYKGSRISQINDINRDTKRPSCKFTEDKDYVQSHSNFPAHRPLLTKAAQKYIPPLKETMRDLKVKLSLPQHSLLKLKQLKISKDLPKINKPNVSVARMSQKPKPKFEDVLKSIDEIQIKMHKEKSKKSKKCIPKVVIKKNENGSHYASTSNKDEFNPDLTGRKWQPWVFIEKNHFIDKMAIKKKTKAVYSHRKRSYVLAEKFQKYKSVNSAKFVISPPISDCPPSGLKYTIRLKHNY